MSFAVSGSSETKTSASIIDISSAMLRWPPPGATSPSSSAACIPAFMASS
jgi:hypothetical protein